MPIRRGMHPISATESPLAHLVLVTWSAHQREGHAATVAFWPASGNAPDDACPEVPRGYGLLAQSEIHVNLRDHFDRLAVQKSRLVAPPLNRLDSGGNQ